MLLYPFFDFHTLYLMASYDLPASIQEITSPSARPENQVRAHKFESGGNKMLPYSRRDYYKIWVTIGTGKIEYANRSIELMQPALIFSNPRVPYSFESTDLSGAYMCIFTEEYLKANGRTESLQESPLFKIGSNPVFLLQPEQLHHISDLYEKILCELNSSYVYRHELVRNYLNLIIHEGMKMEPALSAIHYHTATDRIANLFLELLERQFPIDSAQHALKLKKASDYAEYLSVHVNHLNHAVREITGKSTTMHIAERIITEAKALLRHTDMSIAEVAYCLGFEYPNYFNNFFKKNTGLTPLSLRK
ncbi:MAG TPA: helix-turn-helix domain-containing protein [Chryseolinea sp.]|nr:helix-turn-helix domain-containing protein [Chryseolinea sp.]